MKKNLFFIALVLAVGCASVSCTQLKTKVAGLLNQETAAADADADGVDKILETKELSIVEKCGDAHGYKSGIMVHADYPVGNSIVAKAVANWIAACAVGTSYEGDPMDGKALFEQYLHDFSKENSTEKIMTMVREQDAYDNAPTEENEFEWFDQININKEYDGKYIVSYSYQWFGFHVGNATSNATIRDVTFSKIDGGALGWELFTSKKAVKALIDKALIEKYGREEIDMYDNGIPMPDAPLFMKDSVRFDYSDYSIVAAHFYEEFGCFPSCSIAYKDMMELITDEGKKHLGLAGGKPKARKLDGVSAGKMAVFLSKMDDYINKFDVNYLEMFYADNVKLFGKQMGKEQALKAIETQRSKFGNYEQLSIYPRVTKIDDKTTRCEYTKRVTIDGKTTDYEAYLVLTKDEYGSYAIIEESDKTTDRNLAKD